jgi:hypothetical protein
MLLTSWVAPAGVVVAILCDLAPESVIELHHKGEVVREECQHKNMRPQIM